jgi:hypothetical protein
MNVVRSLVSRQPRAFMHYNAGVSEGRVVPSRPSPTGDDPSNSRRECPDFAYESPQAHLSFTEPLLPPLPDSNHYPQLAVSYGPNLMTPNPNANANPSRNPNPNPNLNMNMNMNPMMGRAPQGLQCRQLEGQRAPEKFEGQSAGELSFLPNIFCQSAGEQPRNAVPLGGQYVLGDLLAPSSYYLQLPSTQPEGRGMTRLGQDKPSLLSAMNVSTNLME